jgi:hypothetical protein
MKKSIILITATILLSFTASFSAKSQNSNPTQFGIKGGVNFSNLYANDSEKDKMLTGFNVGIFSKLPFSGFFAFQPELLFTTKGAEITYDNTFVNGIARFRLNYIEMPLLFVVNITDNFSIHAGPYAAYLVSGDVKNESSVDQFNFEDNINVDDYNRFDAGIAAGASIDFRSVSFGARYTYGLTKVGKEKTYLGTTYTFPDANNGVLSFYASVPLRKN